MPVIDYDSLLGCTYLKSPEKDGSRYRATIIKALEDGENECMSSPMIRKFLAKFDDGKKEFQEIMTYNQICDFLEDDMENEGIWKFKKILGHHKKDGRYKLQVHWEDDTITWNFLKPCVSRRLFSLE